MPHSQVTPTSSHATSHPSPDLADDLLVNVLVIQDPSGIRAYKLDRVIFTLGRSQQADIQLHGSEVSRIHATLLRIRDGQGHPKYRLIDGDARIDKPSQNGTYVNGKGIKTVDLAHHDRIVFSSRVKAKFFEVSRDRVHDLLSAPERWIKEAVNQRQEYETVMTHRDLVQGDSEHHPTLNTGRSKNPEQHSEIKQMEPRQDNKEVQKIQKVPAVQRTQEVPEVPEVSKVQKAQEVREIQRAQRSPKTPPPKNLTRLRGPLSPHTSAPNRLPTQEKLGQFFVRANLIQPEQLQVLLQEQHQRAGVHSHKRIGELLLEKGWISEADLHIALVNQKVHLGQILVNHKLITSAQLKAALSQQIANQKAPTSPKSLPRLGEILMQAGLISFLQLNHALQEQQLRRNGLWRRS